MLNGSWRKRNRNSLWKTNFYWQEYREKKNLINNQNLYVGKQFVGY